MKKKIEMKVKEKCERCGEKAVNIIACFRCKDFHSLCAECLDLYQFTYAGESGSCFLTDSDMPLNKK